MRLTATQKNIIRATIESLLPDQEVEIGVFGSRLNAAAGGGDVDLVIRTEASVPLQLKARIRLRLESLLGLPVDIVFVTSGQAATAFQAMASAKAKPLDGATG